MKDLSATSPLQILRCAQDDEGNEGDRQVKVLMREGDDKPDAMKPFYVYIMASHRRTLYTGMTNDLQRRVYEHKHKITPGFTTRYNITRLVYFEEWRTAGEAIRREKQIKGWLRAKKIALIESENPTWQDLSATLFDE